MNRRLSPTLGLVLVMAFTSSCGSSGSAMNARLIPPRFRVRIVEGQMMPTRHKVPVNVNLLVDVYNDSAEEIVLKRILIRNSPQTSSGILFEPSSRIVNEHIPPRNVKTVDVWLFAWVELPNLDSSSRTVVRGDATFESEYGNFRETFQLPIVESARLRTDGVD